MNSTIVGLVAAIAVLSGGLGFSMTGVFDDQELMTSKLPATGFLMGQVEIEARNADGEIFAYRLSDNEVVDDGEQCILKMLFATAQTATVGRGEYVTDGSGACTGILTGAWNVIAIGTDNDDVANLGSPSSAANDLQVKLGNETSTSSGLLRSMASDITWTNGTTGNSIIKLAKTFTYATASDTEGRTHAIGESGLFNSTTVDTRGMLARQVFTDVSLTYGDSITVTWTFTVGN
mgnify:CR=1 FL=1